MLPLGSGAELLLHRLICLLGGLLLLLEAVFALWLTCLLVWLSTSGCGDPSKECRSFVAEPLLLARNDDDNDDELLFDCCFAA